MIVKKTKSSLLLASSVVGCFAAFDMARAEGGDFAVVELGLGQMNLGADANSTTFGRDSVLMMDGQALLRTGNVMVEIQGILHDGPDVDDVEDVGSSFGAIGHYLTQVDSYQVSLFAGAAGGSNNSESEGMAYGLAGVGLSRDGLTVSVGQLNRVAGEDTSGVIKTMTYLQAGYETTLASGLWVGVDGYTGSADLMDDAAVFGDATFYEASIGIGYDISAQMRAIADYTVFGMMQNDAPETGYEVQGSTFGIKLSVALGDGHAARRATGFDTPHLHREMTWADETFSRVVIE